MGLPYRRRGRRSRGADPAASGRRAFGTAPSPCAYSVHRRRRSRLRRPAPGSTCSATPGTSRRRVCPRPASLQTAAAAPAMIGRPRAARCRRRRRPSAHPPAPPANDVTRPPGDRARHARTPPARPSSRRARVAGGRAMPAARGGIRPARVCFRPLSR